MFIPKENIPVTLNGELVGRANHLEEGKVEITILYQPLIDTIKAKSFRALSVGYEEVVAPRETFAVGDILKSKRS